MSLLYAGLDVSLEMTSICVVDADGRIVLETKVASDPEALTCCLGALPGCFERVGLEAGPLSQWLYFGLCDAGLPTVCIETRHAKAAITAMSMNKTDRNDARSLAQLVRSGWFKSVHVKSVESQELRTLLGSREFFVNKLRDHENEIRGLLRTFGLKIGRISASGFAGRIRDLVADRPRLRLCMEALLTARETFMKRLSALHCELLRLIKNEELCVRFMGVPGAGPVTALAFKAAIDRPDDSADRETSVLILDWRQGSFSPASRSKRAALPRSGGRSRSPSQGDDRTHRQDGAGGPCRRQDGDGIPAVPGTARMPNGKAPSLQVP